MLTIDTTEQAELVRKLSILFVEDDAEVRDSMARYLGRRVDKVHTAQNGVDGLSSFREQHPDLVISDIRMPEVDGMQIYDFLKTKQMESRIVVVTADPFSEDVALFLKETRIKYLKKPFELMKFKQLVLEKLSTEAIEQ